MKPDSVARRQMACLGDASRYRIVSELAAGEACVTELADRIGLSQSCTTRHLQALVSAGLVRRERAGRRVLFRVGTEDPAVRSLLDWKARLETDADLRPARKSRPGRKGSGRTIARTADRRRERPGPDGASPDRSASTLRPEVEPTVPREPAPDGQRAVSIDRDSGDPPPLERPSRTELEDFLL